MAELMTHYGPIDVVFLDGAAEGLKEEAWQMQPKTVVTRGAITTPEQYVPGVPLEGAWEACITMGTAWQYQPQDVYKSGTELIRLLYETRAKGGNLLLNVGPKPDGELPIEQEERLRELALWMFVNGEAIYGVRPWVITNEQTTWFTKKKDENTIFAMVTRALETRRLEGHCSAFRARHRENRGQRSGPERSGLRIQQNHSQDYVPPGRRRSPYPRDVRAALAGQQQMAEPGGSEDYRRGARVFSAAG